MAYCAVQQLLRDSHDVKNVFSTLFSCHQIDSYFEQHHIFEIIGELTIRVCIDQPGDVVEYLCQKLIEISQKYVKNVVKLEFHNAVEDGSKMIAMMSAQHHIPLIECVNNEMSTTEKLKRLDKFLQSNLLHNRRLIICDFKETDKSDRFLRITHRIIDEPSQQCSSKPQDAIDVSLSDDYLNPHRLNCIYKNICNMKPVRMIKGNWNCRTLIVGRIGAGRKTQGALMANEFGLSFIDWDYLMVQYEQQMSYSEKHILGFMGHLQETLLKPDCLRCGYVIVCNVISKPNLEILMEKFIYEPNRIIFIHTSEGECRRRFSSTEGASPTLASTHDRNASLNYQMKLYNLHKKEFVGYFSSTRRHKILHINGNGTIHEIKTLMWANLEAC